MLIKARNAVVRIIEKRYDIKITRNRFPRDMGQPFEAIYRKCAPYSMVSVERMYALYQAVEYVVKSGISGDLVECGVWKGGSSMCMAHSLLNNGVADRTLYLYDTYEGMPMPSAKDRRLENGTPALEDWQAWQKGGRNEWAYSPIEEVRQNMASTGYPEGRIVYVKGLVEKTIPATRPASIALLRLDTDWYESTLHELVHLFPLLSTGGVFIVDDYGHFSGSREAVDEYFSNQKISILLNRIDYSGRLGIKWSPGL